MSWIRPLLGISQGKGSKASIKHCLSRTGCTHIFIKTSQSAMISKAHTVTHWFRSSHWRLWCVSFSMSARLSLFLLFCLLVCLSVGDGVSRWIRVRNICFWSKMYLSYDNFFVLLLAFSFVVPMLQVAPSRMELLTLQWIFYKDFHLCWLIFR